MSGLSCYRNYPQDPEQGTNSPSLHKARTKTLLLSHPEHPGWSCHSWRGLNPGSNAQLLLCTIHHSPARAPGPGTHPEVDSHRGDEAAGEEGAVLEAHQQAGLTDPRVSHQHHLQGHTEGGVSAPGLGRQPQCRHYPTPSQQMLEIQEKHPRTQGRVGEIHNGIIPQPAPCLQTGDTFPCERHFTAPSWGHKAPANQEVLSG